MTTFVSSTEAARMLGVTKPTLYAYVSRGIVDRRTAADGRTSLYARDEVEQLAGRRRRHAPEHPTIDVEISSAITDVQDEGVTYRNHDAAQLATFASFEQVSELLWTGTLPAEQPRWPVDRAALARSRAVVAAAGRTSPIGRLALAATVLGERSRNRSCTGRSPQIAGDRPDAARRAEHRRHRVPTRSRAWRPRPAPQLVAAISRALVLLADHELATSTLAVRVACSVRADPYASIATGLHVVSGPLHGGASAQVAELLNHAAEVGATAAIGRVRARRQRLPGFGHSVYRNGDPRMQPLLDAVRQLADQDQRLATVDAVLSEAGRTIGKHANVDFALGALMFVAALPHDCPMFAVARIAGWAAHYDEELSERPVRYRGLSTRRP